MRADELNTLANAAAAIREETLPGNGWNLKAIARVIAGHNWADMPFSAALAVITAAAKDPEIKAPNGILFMDRPHWKHATAQATEAEAPVKVCESPTHSRCESPTFAECRSEVIAGMRPEWATGKHYHPLNDPPPPATAAEKARTRTQARNWRTEPAPAPSTPGEQAAWGNWDGWKPRTP